MASTTAGQQQQPVMVRGFDVGINPSMLSNLNTSEGSLYQQQQQQQQQQAYHNSLFGSNTKHNRQSSYSSTSSVTAAPPPSAFVIPHVGSSNAGTTLSTEDLVDGLQQSMASMDPAAHHHYHHSNNNKQPSYGPRASSTASSASSSSNNGNAHPGGVSSSNSRQQQQQQPAFDIARSPTFTWHGYRPGSSGSAHNGTSNSANYALDAFPSHSSSSSSVPPNLIRHVSSPSSFLAAAAAAHHPVQQHSFFGASSAVSAGDLPTSGMETPRSPLELFPSPSVASTLQLHADPTSSFTGNNSNNVYPFASINNSHENISNLDGRLSSFHRHQAHAQSNSYSSAFSPSSFLVNGLNSPSSTTSLSPSQAFPSHQSVSNQQHKTPQTKSPPLFDVGSNGDSLQQGLNANNKRPGSTDSGVNVERSNGGRRSTDSPNEDANAKGQQPQQRGRSQGRTPASGKAPSASRQSRSRTRRPSYSRTISPAGSMRTNTGGQQLGASNNNEASNAGIVSNTGSNKDQSTYSNPYAPQLSPYMPGYPSLPSGNIDAALASKPDSTTFEQHIYGASAPSASTAGFNFMKLQEQQALAHAQLQAAAGMATQRPGSANTAINTFDLFVSQQARDSSGLQQRRGSDASNFAPSSLGTVGATGNKKTNAMDLLNSPAAFTGPLPLPHQEGFRSSGVKQDQANGQSGDQDDGDLESSTRGRQPQDDKRRKRRESHNAVERRRRDNINDRITELASLIPEVLLDTGNTGSAVKSSSRSQSRNGRGGDNDDSPDRRGESPSSNAASAFPATLSSNAQFTPAQLAQQAASNRPNKGVILTKSVEYIRYLQQLVQMQGERNRELEIRVRMYEGHAMSGGMVNVSSQIPPGFGGAINNNGMVGSGTIGSPGIPLGGPGSMRSLPPLEEGESTMDEGTGLSHKRDQFTARRSASRNSMNANDGNAGLPASASAKSINASSSTMASTHDIQKKTSNRGVASPRQDILTTQDWLDNGFAELRNNGLSSNSTPSINGHASPPSSGLINDDHHMTFEDLLQVGRSNRVVSDSQNSLASESQSPMASVGKMEEDDENALGMQV